MEVRKTWESEVPGNYAEYPERLKYPEKGPFVPH